MRDRRPLYVQVAGSIKTDFSVSSPTVTVRLPGESALAERYQVSRTTIREAHRLLEQEGSIFARHGVGTFLSSDMQGTTHNFDSRASTNVIISDMALAVPTLIGCTMLPLSRVLRGRFEWSGDTLLRLERLYQMGDEPRSFAIEVVPAAFVGGAVDDGLLDKPLHELLREGGFLAHHVDSLMVAVLAPKRVIKEVPSLADRPVIRSQEVFYDTKGQVLAIALHYQDAASQKFRVRRRAF